MATVVKAKRQRALAAQQILDLRARARAACEPEWGSVAQIENGNDFVTQVYACMSRRQRAEFENYGHKATTDERIAYRLKFLGLARGRVSPLTSPCDPGETA
jgi:hypothetical protein